MRGIETDILALNPECPFAHYVTLLKQLSVTDMAYQGRATPKPGKYQDEFSSEISNKIMLHLFTYMACSNNRSTNKESLVTHKSMMNLNI